jgi:hypothetical protein
MMNQSRQKPDLARSGREPGLWSLDEVRRAGHSWRASAACQSVSRGGPMPGLVKPKCLDGEQFLQSRRRLETPLPFYQIPSRALETNPICITSICTTQSYRSKFSPWKSFPQPHHLCLFPSPSQHTHLLFFCPTLITSTTKLLIPSPYYHLYCFLHRYNNRTPPNQLPLKLHHAGRSRRGTSLSNTNAQEYKSYSSLSHHLRSPQPLDLHQ